MREVVLKTADAGLFKPFWSARILEEWARAVETKLGPVQGRVARGEIALIRAKWPNAEVAENCELEGQLYLPDPADCHVLASAIDAQASVIMTQNLRDFPRQTLQEFEISPLHPDAILRQFCSTEPDVMKGIVFSVHAETERLSGSEIPMRKLMKKARLPRLGKAIAAIAE